ncbi:response regulator [Flavobacterium sp.]|jgi:CheY-like chemotaxis protein|uniref:response regulator n=1 Tax=Flavobacterium sp. TaxID=239 RepID=UPI00261EAFCE|nr:response regulator [Flavobacterium sp.]
MKFNNIFVVDDDLVYHFVIKKLFSKCNVNAQTKFFFNGLEAIDGLKHVLKTENEPDLILLDINMPVYDGWQFLDEFRKLKGTMNKDITVYLVSSSNDSTDINKSKEYKEEVKDYYFKPITTKDFEEMLTVAS